MDLFEVALGFEMDGRFRVRSAIVFGGTRRAHVAELALNQFEHFLVRDVSGRGDHQVIGGKPVPEARKKRITVKCFYGIRRAENRAAERMTRPETAVENLVKEIFGIVQVHFYFFNDDLAFLLNIFGIEFWAQDKVSNDVKSNGQVFVKNFGIATDLF